MDPITNALISSGGLGLLACVLFYLHQSAQKMFVTQLQEERQSFKEELKEEREYCDRRHEAVMAKLNEMQAAWR